MHSRDVARLLLLAGLWGGSFAFMRVAAPAMGPVWLAFSRVALAFIALLALALARRAVPPFLAHWRDYVVIGTVNSALPFALFCFAEQYIEASTAAILNATSPFFATAVAALWLKEALSLRKLGAMALGLAGVVLLVGWSEQALSGMRLPATLACLGAALCYGVASVYAKRRMATVPSSAVALYSQLTAAAVLAPGLLFAPVPGPLTPLVVGNTLALALASTALAYLLYFRLIATIGPARALTVTFLIPVFGVLWGVLFLDEAVTVNTLSGCALILAGTAVAVRGAPVGARARPSSG
ncbi:MAG TPA: DMT family transporter [Casimicrobiaceae bacterium]|jgi:drug/metabolite transporter (DMT)-like permease|nr:DMT family transporter [Casimicrobiaceae bacterium]